MKTSDIITAKEWLTEPKKIVIIPHKNPDGDAMGSALGLYHWLIQKHHEVTVIAPNEYPLFLKWMPGDDRVLIYESNSTKANSLLLEADIIFTDDFNALSRIEEMQGGLKDTKAKFIMIDHHQAPEDYAAVTYSDVTMSSTCEMVYNFMSALGDASLLNKDVATCLYTGIMTDTGSFRFASTTPETHRVVASLIENGAENATIHNNIYDSNSFHKLQLLGVALKNLVYMEAYHTAYITLTRAELDAHQFKKGDTEGFVNYGLSINGAKLAAIFIESEQDNYVKISLRSKGSFDVNTFARRYYNGGGHINAAGGRSDKPLQETIADFKNYVAHYQNELSL